MGTTRIKVIDLSSDKGEIKTSRKHAEKLSAVSKLKAAEGPLRPPSREAGLPSREAGHFRAEKKSKQPEAIQPEAPKPKTGETKQQSSKPKKHRHHLGKKYQQALQLVDRKKLYPLEEALDLLAKTSTVKFDPTVEIHLNVVDKNIKGKINLPHPQGKKKEKKILVFSDPPSKALATAGKQIIWGDEKTIEDIASGKIKPNKDFNMVFSTPKFMPYLAKIAKILGPAQMMPNPKNGTVVENVQGAIENSADSSLVYKTDPTAPIIHTTLGKLSAKPKEIEENLKAIIFAIGPSKIKKATVATTMSVPIKLDISSVGK